MTIETKEPEVDFAETPASKRRTRQNLGPMVFLTLAVAVIVLGIVIYSGIRARAAADVNLKRVTEQAAIPPVNVVYPTKVAPDEEIVLPGNTQAFTDAPIYARTNGYLKRWYCDIGAQVKQGGCWLRLRLRRSTSSCNRLGRASKPHRRT